MAERKGGRAKRRVVRSPSPARSSAVTATEAQNNFGAVLGRALEEGAVTITRHGRPAAVVLSTERYRSLVEGDDVDLGDLATEFDALIARMRTPEATAGYDALFEATGTELGEAAARRHGGRARRDQ